MKLLIALGLLAVLLAAPGFVQNANAQLEFTLGGGLNAPLGEYGDQASTGYALTTGLGYRVNSIAMIGVEASYSGNGATDDALADLGDGYDMSSSILQYSAIARLVFPVGGHNLFAKGSVGYYRASATVTGPGGEYKLKSTDPGYAFGGGFLINGDSGVSLIADVTYHFFSYEGEGDTDYLTVTLGGLFRFDLFKSDLRDDLQDEIDELY